MPYEYKHTEHMVQIAGHNKVVNTGGKKIPYLHCSLHSTQMENMTMHCNGPVVLNNQVCGQ